MSREVWKQLGAMSNGEGCKQGTEVTASMNTSCTGNYGKSTVQRPLRKMQ